MAVVGRENRGSQVKVDDSGSGIQVYFHLDCHSVQQVCLTLNGMDFKTSRGMEMDSSPHPPFIIFIL